MKTPESNDDVVFDYRTLRLVIGALAFAFPTVVITLTGKVTTSISASYHEAETRDVFVGFLFIIGALLISYRGHLQGEPRPETQSAWSWFLSFRWVKVYQEDLISAIGGFAAIFTALYPTARDGDPMDSKALVHTLGAFILFANVVYFCLIAFLRSLNRKLVDEALVREDGELMDRVNRIRSDATRTNGNLFRKVWNFLTLETRTFLAIAKQVFRRYDEGNVFVRIWKLLWEHDKMFTRGVVYVVCGSLIALTLLVFILLLAIAPGRVAGTVTTFIVETLALGFFGAAWITASKLAYISKIEIWLKSRARKTRTAAQPEAA